MQEGHVRVSLYSLISSLRISSISEAISIFFRRSTFLFRMAVSSYADECECSGLLQYARERTIIL